MGLDASAPWRNQHRVWCHSRDGAKDFKLVLAYSSISHMGIVLLGLAAFNVSGLQGAVFN